MSKHHIGTVAAMVGCRADTIRYYEKQHLIPNPQRSSGGQRLYDETAIDRLRFILRGRELGFSLNQIHRMLAILEKEDGSAIELRELTAEHLNDVRQQIESLRAKEQELDRLLSACESEDLAECPIVRALGLPVVEEIRSAS